MTVPFPIQSDDRPSYGSGSWLQVRASTASAEIVSQIRQRLFDGLLKPGDFLGTESSLSQEFGVSRITLRDALRILEANGIVYVKVGKSGGVRVSEPNPERFADALAVQLMLAGITEKEVFDAQMGAEMRAAELAAENASAEDLAALDAQIERCAAAVGDQEGFARQSLNFHLELIKASHNRALLAQFHALRHVSSKAILRSNTPARAQNVLERHKKTLAAVRARDAVSAAAGIREHFRQVIEALLARARKTSEPSP
ncbi:MULTISPECIES: FCD domain-containing protein [unclassified Beijerinckia]|uniref:FadR/GntR family transcriptional regulator n=1 Tax=unclassified Beijerinckia TaxID=2638183 RepID=UPI00089472E4|nr:MULTISPECIES: FCD domain-containing protein [unclassified Beijerinckia]MDH7799378.1 GntR family transcriptional repressor for pyruvate dehydrogenase complex [Beijerinckia sp. GAS462]SED48223.1 transcriptional regulator, GntR family [Beijerinckia sp. 28-YEA-48]